MTTREETAETEREPSVVTETPPEVVVEETPAKKEPDIVEPVVETPPPTVIEKPHSCRRRAASIKGDRKN